MRNRVLAHFLDGEVPTAAASAELARHLDECDCCRRELARARRLDGLLASISGVEVPSPMADRLLRRAEQAARPPAPPPARTPARRVRTALAFVVLGFALAVGLERAWPKPAVPEPPPPGPDVVAVPEAPGFQLPEVSLDGVRPRLRLPALTFAPPRGASDTARLERLLLGPELWRSMLAGVALRAAWFGGRDPGTWCARADAQTALLRERALDALLASSHRSAREAILQRVLFARTDRDAFLVAARKHDGFLRWLNEELRGLRPDANSVAVAARLGSVALDEALRRWAGGDAVRAGMVAEHTAAFVPRPRRVDLLLALWCDLQARGHEAGDAGSLAETRAHSWFAPLRGPATEELVQAFRGSSHATIRRHCLLAIAARGDEAALPLLLELVHGARADERTLAAYALSRCQTPAVVTRLRAEVAHGRRVEHLHAALLGARDPSMLRQIAAWELSSEERAFLEAGPFSWSQFPIALALCQRRPVQPF